MPKYQLPEIFLTKLTVGADCVVVPNHGFRLAVLDVSVSVSDAPLLSVSDVW
jgi:hypothetical protein